jgi:hypothetical protein
MTKKSENEKEILRIIAFLVLKKPNHRKRVCSENETAPGGATATTDDKKVRLEFSGLDTTRDESNGGVA